jgi:hypothetical protein
MHGGADAKLIVVERFDQGFDSFGRMLAGKRLHIERCARSAAGVATDVFTKWPARTAVTFAC